MQLLMPSVAKDPIVLRDEWFAGRNGQSRKIQPEYAAS
jgi:hypothetical protein